MSGDGGGSSNADGPTRLISIVLLVPCAVVWQVCPACELLQKSEV